MTETANRSGSVKAVMGLFLALAWITFPMRLWVRVKMLKTFGVDDILTTLTMAVFTVFGAWALYAAEYGTGRHNDTIPPDRLIKALRGWWLAETFYIVSCVLLKCAFGSFLLRVATEKPHRMIIWGLITVNVIFYLFYFFQSIFQCVPVDYYWNRVNPAAHGHCHNPSFTADSTFAQSAVSIVTDISYAILPIIVVRKLQMSRYKRISLSFVLGLGAIASVAVIVRIPYVVTLADSADFLWQTTDVAIWSCVEPGLGLTIINLVVTRPLLRSALSRFNHMSSAAMSRKQGYSSKVSGYRKPSTYGTSTTITSTTNGVSSCDDPNCQCNCHKPGAQGTHLSSKFEEAKLSEAERGFAMVPVSPTKACLKHSGQDIRRTTEILQSSTTRSETELEVHPAKSLPEPPSRDGLSSASDEDLKALVKGRSSAEVRRIYQGIGKSGVRRAI